MENEHDFFDRVYEVCRKIPYGRVSTYGAIAKAIGAPKSARMVGWALNKSTHLLPPVPAHRVLNRNGMLSGKKAFENPNEMQRLLEKEGLEVHKDQVVSFEKYFWDPLLLSEF